MNLPNQLTLVRFALTVCFVAAMSTDFPGARFVALLLFLVASLTDYLDGMIARKYNLITDFGKLMDPLADKVLTASAFILLIPAVGIPAWTVIAIIAREFLITGLRSLASARGVVLPAEKIGKHKTVWQMITITFYLGVLALGDVRLLPTDWLAVATGRIGPALLAVTVILTIYSGTAYFWKNRFLIETR